MNNIAHVIDAIISLKDQFSGTLKTVNGNLSKFQKQANYVAKDTIKVGRSIEGVGKNLISHVTMPLVGIGVAALKASSDFTNSIAKVSTIADTTQVPIGTLRKEILKLSGDTGIASTEIADNVYNAISAGQKTGDAVNFVKNSTMLAKAGFAEAGESLDLLTTILNAYKLKAEDVGKVSDYLITTQNEGKVTVAELSSSMGKIIPTAVSTSVAMDQISAGYALMTKNGIKAAESTTYMSSMLNEISRTGSVSDKALRKISGKSFTDLMKSGKSVSDVLNILKKGADKSHLSLKDMFGSAEAGKAALILSSDAGKDFTEMLGKMNESVGATKKAFDKMQTPGEKFKISLNKIKIALMQLGDVLAPVMEKVTEYTTKLGSKLSNLTPKQLDTIAKFMLLALAIGPIILVVGKLTSKIGKTIDRFNKLSKAISKAGGIMKWIISPGHLVVLALVALVIIAILLVKNWDKVTKAFKKFKKTLKDHEAAVKNTAKILGVIFGPAILKIGTQAALTGVKLAVSLTANIIELGLKAVITGAQITVSFIGSLIKTSAQVVATALVITGKLIVALINFGIQALVATGILDAQTAAWLLNKVQVIANTVALGAQKVATLASAAATKICAAATWIFNAALLANPIAATIGALVLLGIGIYEVVKHWKEICTWIGKAWDWLTKWNHTKAENKTTTVTTNQVTQFSQAGSYKPLTAIPKNPGHNALGTNYWRGGKTWVGENGPELIDLPKSTRITDHRDSTNKKNNEGNVTIEKLADTIIVREDADIDKIVNKLVKKLKSTGLNKA